MDINFWIVSIFYLSMNMIAFLVMMMDKSKSRKKQAQRIAEGTLFFMASAFGSVGVYLGMFIFHHKTRKITFVIGIPLIMIQNIVFLSLTYDFLNSLR